MGLAETMSEATVQTWNKFIERLESGDIDQDIKEASVAIWHDVVGKLKLLSELLDCSLQADAATNCSNAAGNSSTTKGSSKRNYGTELDSAYEALETQLITARRVVKII